VHNSFSTNVWAIELIYFSNKYREIPIPDFYHSLRHIKILNVHFQFLRTQENTYRIYSRISRGFLDNFLIKNWMGRGIKIYIF